MTTFTAVVTITADTDTVRDIAAPAMAGVHVELKNADGTGVDSKAGTDLVYTFAGLPAGKYTVDAYSVDVNGAIVGSVITTPFEADVAPPTTTTVKTVSAVAVTVTAQ
jgi:hypothetical protein